MYWSRTGSILDIAIFLLLSLGWAGGGWLLATHAFRLRASERLLVGFALGLVAFIAISNLLANLVPVPLAFWAASGLLLLGGLAAAWRSPKQPWLDLRELRAWPQMAVLFGLTLLFALIGSGLALFDDYLHLPLVSVMAAGDIPPHFYLNPPARFAYHYGLQVFAAALVRTGGLFPWSAWDLSKALAIALTLVLSWLWYRRLIRSQRGAFLGGLLVNFAGGARWLLLLLPVAALARMSAQVQLTNTGADTGPDLRTVLSLPWVAEGSGPFPFPFAFHNGIFGPVTFNLGASGALPFLAVILLLLLASQLRPSLPAVIATSLVFAALALSAEHLFVFLWGGIALAGAIYLLYRRRSGWPAEWGAITPWASVLLLSGILSLVQGAFITEAVRNVLLRLQGVAQVQGNYNYFEFSPRWPPALVSAHFGELSLANPSQLVVLLAELGPALLLAPIVTVYAWRSARRADFLLAGLGLAALLTMLLALFFRYGVERSSTRLPATALWIWVLLGFPLLWGLFPLASPLARFGLRLGYIVSVFGGLVLFAVQMLAMPSPQITYFANYNDARLSRELWNQLPEEAEVLDIVPYRAIALFGRPARSHIDFYHGLPEWEALIQELDPAAVARSGYAFIYMDDEWWWSLGEAGWNALSQDCVQVAAEQDPQDGDFRWLLDVRGCK